VEGKPVSERKIGHILGGLASAPLGLWLGNELLISIVGAGKDCTAALQGLMAQAAGHHGNNAYPKSTDWAAAQWHIGLPFSVKKRAPPPQPDRGAELRGAGASMLGLGGTRTLLSGSIE
jgi:hypothetical protein